MAGRNPPDSFMEEGRLTGSLKDYVVGSVPTVYYIPEYITATEEEQLLNNIYRAPISKWKTLKNRRLQNWGGVVHEKGLLPQDLPRWLKEVTQRICEESNLFPKAINHVLINEYLPDQGIMPHQDGPAYVPVVAILSLGSPVVMDFAPHPSFENAKEVSENSRDNSTKVEHIEMSSGKKLSKHPPFSVVLMPRSLLIFKDTVYSDYLHGIQDCNTQRFDEAVNISKVPRSTEEAQAVDGMKSYGEADDGSSVIYRTDTRVSLTCRVVSKVRRHLIKL
ncbi:uncharacterized protein LOC127259266 [Andrographis paniculata]|uniref:uncharacterized protein LOC127259266 n=1 Tax=Andrographis paniculata TaxID=175694 RepID=UPI0021E9392A|nr:uncharacterized protein LOC127259266 [Andrographis paniculata]